MTWGVVAALGLSLAVLAALPAPAAALDRLRSTRASPVWEQLAAAALAKVRGERRVRAAGLDEVPQALDLLAACLAAGSPMATAVATVAEVSEPATGEVLGRVVAQLRLGRSAPDAWSALSDHPHWGAPARDIARSARSGTSLAQVLQVHADDARRRSAAAATKAARQVGVKSVLPLMACFLPAFVLVGVVPIIAGLLTDFLGP